MPTRLALNTGPSADGGTPQDRTRCGAAKGDRGDIVAVDKDDEERPDQQLDVERGQSAFVEQTRDLNDWLVRHHSYPDLRAPACPMQSNTKEKNKPRQIGQTVVLSAFLAPPAAVLPAQLHQETSVASIAR